MAVEFAVACVVLLADLEELHLHLRPTADHSNQLWEEPPRDHWNTPALARPGLDELLLLCGHPRLRLVSVQGTVASEQRLEELKSSLCKLGCKTVCDVVA